MEWIPNQYTNKSFYEATTANISLAKEWIYRNICAGRTTEMTKPLERAIELLNLINVPGILRIPTIILITDGSTPNEHALCKMVLERNSPKNETNIEIYREEEDDMLEDEDTSEQVRRHPRKQSQKKRQINNIRIFTFGKLTTLNDFIDNLILRLMLYSYTEIYMYMTVFLSI